MRRRLADPEPLLLADSISLLWPESIYFGSRIYLFWWPVPIIGWNLESISIYFIDFQYIYLKKCYLESIVHGTLFIYRFYVHVYSSTQV
jgi:hypothetical protein